MAMIGAPSRCRPDVCSIIKAGGATWIHYSRQRAVHRFPLSCSLFFYSSVLVIFYFLFQFCTEILKSHLFPLSVAGMRTIAIFLIPPLPHGEPRKLPWRWWINHGVDATSSFMKWLKQPQTSLFFLRCRRFDDSVMTNQSHCWIPRQLREATYKFFIPSLLNFSVWEKKQTKTNMWEDCSWSLSCS